jgi:copper(I)-binding protein
MRSITIAGRIAAVAAAGIITVTSLASTASAHEDGHAAQTGASCDMSGIVDAHLGDTRVCSKDADGNLVWGQALTSTRTLSGVHVHDGWAKVAKRGEMSAAFGTIGNHGAKPLTIVAATSPYAVAVQLHEMAMVDGAMVMREVAGGFKIPADGSLELKPGGNHLMFMGLVKGIKAGRKIPVTLIASNGSRVTIKVPAKPFNGAHDDYDAGMGHDADADAPMGGMH